MGQRSAQTSAFPANGMRPAKSACHEVSLLGWHVLYLFGAVSKVTVSEAFHRRSEFERLYLLAIRHQHPIGGNRRTNTTIPDLVLFR